MSSCHNIKCCRMLSITLPEQGTYFQAVMVAAQTRLGCPNFAQVQSCLFPLNYYQNHYVSVYYRREAPDWTTTQRCSKYRAQHSDDSAAQAMGSRTNTSPPKCGTAWTTVHYTRQQCSSRDLQLTHPPLQCRPPDFLPALSSPSETRSHDVGTHAHSGCGSSASLYTHVVRNEEHTQQVNCSVILSAPSRVKTRTSTLDPEPRSLNTPERDIRRDCNGDSH